jgi:hypothetical protein
VYDVLLVVENAMGVETIRKNCLVAVTPGASAQQEPAISTLGVFPNPASDWVQLEWPSEASALVCTISDLSGKVVGQQALHNASPLLDVQFLAPGCYFLRLQGKTRYWIARLIIQR